VSGSQLLQRSRSRTVPPLPLTCAPPLPQRAPASPNSRRKKRGRKQKKLSIVTATTRTPVLESAPKAAEGKRLHTGSHKAAAARIRHTQAGKNFTPHRAPARPSPVLQKNPAMLQTN
jgi:hypothetical protein